MRKRSVVTNKINVSAGWSCAARVFAFYLGLLNLTTQASDWPRFRGPNGSGVSDASGLPVQFGPTNNLAWKAEAPAGSSSPIVTDDHVFLTGYDGNQRLVWCLNQKSGERLWERSIETALLTSRNGTAR